MSQHPQQTATPANYNYNYNTAQYPQYRTLPMGGIVSLGLAGAVITGAMTAARDLREAKAGNMTRSEAMGNVVKEALGGGLATAAGAAAASATFRSGALSLVAMTAVTIGVKYLYDGMSGTGCDAPAPATVPAESATKKK